MKTKLKKPQDVAGLSLAQYFTKLKADLNTLDQHDEEEGPVNFILKANFTLGKDDSNTLFVAGLNNDWKKFIKENKWFKSPADKEVLFGTCVRDGDEISLTIKKGKLKPALFKKAIKANKVLKSLEWKIVKEQEDDAAEADEVVTVNEDDKKQVADWGRQIIPLIRSLQQEEDKTAKEALNEKIDAIAEQIFVIENWEAYLPEKLQAVLSKLEKKEQKVAKEEQKLYEVGSELFDKLYESYQSSSNIQLDPKEFEKIKQVIDKWATFNKKVQGTTFEDELKHLEDFRVLQEQVVAAETLFSSLSQDLSGFEQAIQDKKQLDAFNLKASILQQL